jgi:phage terminase large subunit
MTELNWREPDYEAVYAERAKRLLTLRADPNLLAAVKEHYKTHPADFINDWGMTFDPRNAEINLPTTVPFILFERQVEFIDWLYERWRNREDGLCEKSRDMGVSWLCIAFACWMILFYDGAVCGFGSRKEIYVDDLADPGSLFWKGRMFMQNLPVEFRPTGWTAKKDAPFMKITNPDNKAVIIGEAGDNIGRGNRTSIYFKDESAFYERPEIIDAALSQTSNVKIDVSTVNGSGNPFYRKRHSGKIPVFIFDWHDDPRKNEAWYQKQVDSLDPVVVASEIDRNYESSVSNVFIPGDLVKAAASRGPSDTPAIGKLRVGIDVARFGNDSSVITIRRGRVLLKQTILKKMDLMHVASVARNEINAYGEAPEQIAVDVIGLGAGVADIMRGWYKPGIVVDVTVSDRMDNGQDYNLRAYMWREMRNWLKTASIPNDQDLRSDLTALRYGFRGGELLLESKDDAKKRGVKSPDRGDSIALTFAKPTMLAEKQRMPREAIYVPFDPGMGT